MRTLRLTTLLSLTFLNLVSAGCADDGGGTDELGDSASETASGSETANASETGTGTADTDATSDTSSTTTTTTTETGTDTDPTTETGTGTDTNATSTETTSDTSGETTDTTTGGGVCEPAPGDDACTSCLKDNCCDEITTCYANPDCACVADCFQGGGDPFSCLMQCGVNMLPPEVQQLGGCTQMSCGNECGL